MATRIQESRRKRPSEKAIYHHVTGTGKSRVRRKFFGLTKQDEAEIRDVLEEIVGKNASRDN